MIQNTQNHSSRHGMTLWRWTVSTITVLVMSIGSFTPFAISTVALAKPAAAPTNHLTLSVVDAESNAGISEYKYLINIDNTGNPLQDRNDGCSPENAGYPDSCDWPSIRAVPGAAPIFTQGNQDDFNGTVFNGLDLPDGRYLISIMANGYKMGGIHFTMPMESGAITVGLQPHPMPAATMRIKVFEDNASVNGQFDTDEAGLAGFHAVISDILGQVSTDVFGNPLCTTYDGNGDPNGLNLDGCLISDANGDMAIPNLGPNRFDVVVVPPPGTTWTETTTLEGSPSWDTWLQEGGTGLDNEFVVAGEPFPWTMFGFVKPMDNLNSPSVTGGISGTLVSASVYLPQQGALPYFGDIWSGFTGTKVNGPIKDGWVALSDLQAGGDQAVYIQRANPDGTFAITNVPNGNYLFTWWDQNLSYILDWIQVTVANGQMTDIGTPMLTGWFTKVDGYVFNDVNSNGKRDPGEPGISDYLVVLKDRDNSEIDRMSISATTDANGYYLFEKAYPMGSWMILEAYNDRYYTTGVTYQVENQPDETTVLGAGVDVGILPILGQSGRLDWGVRPYARGTNGGIVGTVFYDTTRNELDPQYQAVEGWAPGIPGLLVTLSKPIYCGTNDGVPCDPTETYELAPDGSIAKDMTAGGVACGTTPGANCNGDWELDENGNFKVGPIVSTAITETWEQPTDCIARDAHGNELNYPTDQAVLPPDPTGKRCLEGPLVGTQFQSDFASLDGNYGFDTVYSGFGSMAEPVGDTIPADDYLVEVVTPLDSLDRPMYQVVREEDINIFGGDEFIPAVPPPACAGPLHTVDVAGVGVDGPDAVDNPSFAEAGGSVFEGMDRPLCNVKLVTLNNGKSVAPSFTYFTEVPIPGRWKGYIIDDLTVSTNPIDLMYGEKAGAPLMPIGIYDFKNHMVASMVSDPNGVFEVLLPSTYSINCPTPSGVCPNVYYMLGNDPDLAGYNPQYRTIGASFEIYPGLWIPSDLAPTQIVSGVLAAGSLFSTAPQCTLDNTIPQLFRVSQPYGARGSSFTITGSGFGSVASAVTLDGNPLNVTAWNPTSITVSIPNSMPVGPHQLTIIASNGKSTVNGLTYHVTSTGNGNGNGTYNPLIYEVGPGKTYATIQAAVNAAANANGNRPRLVVVYPSSTGTYYENVIVNAKLNLQGVGPGGTNANGKVPGSVIDGRGVTGDNPYADAWNTFITGLNWSGNQSITEGPVVYVVAQDGDFNNTNPASIDGFIIQGGDQQGFPNQVVAAADPTVKEVTGVQGGGIYVNGYARYLRITNNVLQSNGGSYGGAIRLGTPNLPAAYKDSQNDFIRIANNRILANGSTNLAGAVAIYSGTEGYEVTGNDICGNFSAEYGGGISHYGLSPNGSIHHNRIYFNRSYDEGGGIMIAGELPANPNTLTPGAGAVNIYANLLQNNLANDDGGGLRFLMAGNFQYNVYNNIIVNNVSTHEGGGVSLNDAPNVRFYNNTVMNNITTATAMTSNGQPAPAGLSTSRNSNLLQATLPGGIAGCGIGNNAKCFSDPLLFNNIFWGNRAGTFLGSTVAGIGLAGDPFPINYWDLGVSDGIGVLSPTNSFGQTASSASPGTDPQVVTMYDSSVRVMPWRGNPRFVDILMVTADATPNLLGDYHLKTTSPAINAGAASKSGVNAPSEDFDRQTRPSSGGYEIGADEVPPTADLSITKTDNLTTVSSGTQVRYTITVTNAGPTAVTGATVTDNFPTPSPLSGTINWNCTTTSGATCGGLASGSGNINRTVNMPVGSTVTFTTTSGSVASDATGSLSNTASVAVPAGIFDPNLANNNATDTDVILTTSNLSVTKTDNVSAISAGGQVTYTIVVSNSGPQPVVGAAVTDTLSAGFSSFNWTCSASANSSCAIGSGGGTTFNATVNLLNGGSATFTATAKVSPTATGSVTNTATVTAPVNTTDPNLANNTAADTDTIITAPAIPALGSLDNFNRNNANTLGGNWSQITVPILGAAIRVNGNQAFANVGGWAVWNNPSAGYGNRQGAAYTFSNAPASGLGLDPSLVLKASGGSAATPQNYIRVSYQSGTNSVTVTTVNGGTVTRATFGVTFASGDTLSATAIQNGTVYVYKNGVAIGAVTIPTSGAGAWTYGANGGRIGIILPTGQRVDNFLGGNIP